MGAELGIFTFEAFKVIKEQIKLGWKAARPSGKSAKSHLMTTRPVSAPLKEGACLRQVFPSSPALSTPHRKLGRRLLLAACGFSSQRVAQARCISFWERAPFLSS